MKKNFLFLKFQARRPKNIPFWSGIFLSRSRILFLNKRVSLSLSLSMRSIKAYQRRERRWQCIVVVLLRGVVLCSRWRAARVLLSHSRRREKHVPRRIGKVVADKKRKKRILRRRGRKKKKKKKTHSIRNRASGRCSR